MPIDVERSQKYYVEGAKAKADKLVEKFTAAPDKLKKARSKEAENLFKAKVVSDLAIAKRRAHLADITEDEVNAAMEEKGKAAYRKGVEVGQNKWGRRFEPFAKEIDTITPELKAKEVDAETNVINRVVPIAVGLQNKAKKLYGVE